VHCQIHGCHRGIAVVGSHVNVDVPGLGVVCLRVCTPHFEAMIEAIDPVARDVELVLEAGEETIWP
jgi:hypothetical protein